MGYDAALDKAWMQLSGASGEQAINVDFFCDTYSVDWKARKIILTSSKALAKDFTAVLVLHYVIAQLKGLAPLENEWVSFKELEGGESYYPAFRKRAIEPIISKYGNNPVGLYSNLEKLKGKKAGRADAGIIIEAFSGVPVMALIWKSDEEFSSEANILFDRSISRIFCTEDVAVLAGYITKYV